MSDLPGEREQARALWAEVNEQFADADGRARWADADLGWGLFRIPESTLGALGEVAARDVLELGCGTAYVSAQVARRGGRPVALDLSPDQLRTARSCQRDGGPWFPLVEASADSLPLRDASFDLVVSEYGAAPWCAPARWLPEAARVLRDGGRLVLLTHSPLVAMCVPEEGGVAVDRLLRPQRSLREVTWPGGGTEHHPGHGEWIGHLRAAGFVVDALLELHPEEGAVTPEWYEIVTAEWARDWPAEDLWVARRTARAGLRTPDRSVDAT